MSADIHIRENGIASMAYRGQTPWHSDCNVINPEDTPEQISEKCGFNFSLIGRKAGYVDPAGSFVSVEGKQVVTRSDTGAAIGVVGERYKFHQPKEILDFFLSYGKQFNLDIETAGVLGRGERYWALGRTEVDADLNGSGQDIASLYALLATACDGSMVTIAIPTAVRVVCANTWKAALESDSVDKSKARQSHRSAFSNERAAEGLGFDLDAAASVFHGQVNVIRQLNGIKVTDRLAASFFRALIRPSLVPSGVYSVAAFDGIKFNEGVDREVRGFEALQEAYGNAPGARPGTARGLWEATTYFIDHLRDSDNDSRFKSAVFGQGDEIKDRAWRYLLSIIETA